MADKPAPATLLKRTFKEFLEDDCPTMAAALSYYIVFSLPPLLVLLLLVAGFFMSPEQVEAWIQSQASPDDGAQIRSMIEGASERIEGGFSIGLILGIAGLIFSATGAFGQLQKALNAAWAVEIDPEESGKNKVIHLLSKRLLSLGMIVVVAFLIVVAMSISGVISAFSEQIAELVAPVGIGAEAAQVLAWTSDAVVSLVILTAVFALLFKVIPDVQVRWKDIRFGAFVTAVLFVIGKMVIGWYIGQSNPGEAFGAAGALAAIMIFVYYASMIVLLGAEFTQVWAQRQGEGIRPARHAVRVLTEKRHVRGTDPGASGGT